MATVEELDTWIALGHEQRGVEFKSAGPRTERLLLAKVARAAMGMSNQRDGGKVVIGVSEAADLPHVQGLSAAELRTWRYDWTASSFGLYADPSINFHREVVHHRDGDVVVLHVAEFSEVPVLCKKSLTVSGRMELREGACYVRSAHMPATVEVSTQEEMRALLDLGLDKALIKWVGQGGRAGAFGAEVPHVVPPPGDDEQFRNEAGDL